MKLHLVEQIARATLYEGYMLYPYRPSSVKNQQRFNFGVLYPRSYSEAAGVNEAWRMQTECLALANPGATIEIRVRFLRLVQRQIFKLASPVDEITETLESNLQPVDSLTFGEQVFQTWQEANEEEVCAPIAKLGELEIASLKVSFSLEARRSLEAVRNDSGQVAGAIVRQLEPLHGEIEISCQCDGDVMKVTVVVTNQTPLEDLQMETREQALRHATISTHTILGVAGSEFVSLLDPPERFRAAAAACVNSGAWPVLVGKPGEREIMLSSPIILYDYPEVAAESAGDLFDGTEIDEILTLRIMTLTDEEKREMRSADDRARRILERTESLPVEQFMKMHGALRGLKRVVSE